MNCQEISAQLGFSCRHINDGLLYVESPLALSFDGQLIGAYVQDIGRGKVRITDNADIMFCAITHGLQAHAKRASRLATLAADAGLALSDAGELHAVCPTDTAGFQLARFIETASRFGDIFDDALTPRVSKFERLIGGHLESAFGNRLRRRINLTGASGHQLEFSFVLDPGTPNQTIVQPISVGRNGRPHWPSVYGAVGKMGDLKNGGDRTKRTVVLQQGDEEATRQASIALAEHSSIIIFEGRNKLVAALTGIAA